MLSIQLRVVQSEYKYYYSSNEQLKNSAAPEIGIQQFTSNRGKESAVPSSNVGSLTLEIFCPTCAIFVVLLACNRTERESNDEIKMERNYYEFRRVII